MFTEEGLWKEFGIGRNPNTHTWLPFWLFVVIWAILSYIIVLMIAGTGSLPGVGVTTPTPTQQEPEITYKNFEPIPKGKGSRGKRSNSLIPGYYILNREATEIAGTPKYIYLGAEPPGVADA